MTFAVIGAKKSEGVFNDKPYSNYVFYFTDLDSKDRVGGILPYTKGNKVITYKVKTDEWNSNLEPKDYINQSVNLTFDVYGNVASMELA